MQNMKKQRAENRSQKWGISAAPGWWVAVPEGERALLHAIARMLRSARRSQLPEVARAAAKWERGIGCFVKVRLIGEEHRTESRKQKAEMGKWDHGTTGLPTTGLRGGKAESWKAGS